MKKYKTPNGSIVDESVLRQKYGARFDSLVGNGTFTLHTESVSSDVYKTPNGSSVSESTLREKYGDKFDSLVSDGTLKKKEAGDLAGLASFGGAAVAPSPTPSPSKEKNNLAQSNIAIGAGSSFDNGSTEDVNLIRPGLSGLVSEDAMKTPISDKQTMRDYLQSISTPAKEEVKGDKGLITKSIAEKLSKVQGLGTGGILKSIVQDNKDRNNSIIESVQKKIYEGVATKSEIENLANIEEAKPFLNSYLNVYADKLPEGDILAPGDHWDSAWKNSTFENRPVTVSKLENASNYYDNIINGISGAKILYSQASPYAKVFPDNENDKSFEETISGVNSNSTSELSELKNKLSSKLLKFKDSTGKDIDADEIIEAINFKIDNIERSKPIDRNLLDGPLSDRINEAIGKVVSDHKGLITDNTYFTDDEDGTKRIDLVKRGINYAKSADPVTYINAIRGLNDKSELAESDYQYFLAKGQQLENQNNFISSAKDISLVGNPLNFNLETKGSLVAKRSGLIGEFFKEKGVSNKMSFSNDEIDYAVNSIDWAKYNMEAPTKKETDFIKLKEGQWFYDQIPKTGAISSIVKGFQQPFLAISKTVEDKLSGSYAADYLKSKELDRRTSGEQLTPDDRGRYGSGLGSERGNIWNTILEGAGSFIPQILLTKGLGAPASSLAKASVLSSIPRAALTADQLFLINTATGTMLSSYLQSYGDGYEGALQKTGDPVKAEAIGNIGGIIDGVMEQWLPETKIGRNIVRNLKGDLPEKLLSIIKKGGDPADVLKSTKNLLKPFVSEYLNVTGQEMAEEGTAVLLKQMAETLISPSTAKNNDVLKDLSETLWSTALQTVFPSVGSGLAASKNRFTKKVFNQAALDVDYTNDVLKKALLKGSINQEEFNGVTSLITTHRNSIANSPEENNSGGKIENQDRLEYAYEETRIKINKEKLKNAEGVQKEMIEGKIKESEDAQRNILFPKESPKDNSSKTFTDFDNTLFKDGKLTPLGEDIKARVAAGEDISILTSREATPENIQFIKDQIGVDEKDIVAGLTPEGKAGFLTPGSTFYDDNEDNLAAAKKIAGVNVVDSKAPETTLFDRVQESGNDGIKQLYSTPESITELQDQALTTPSNINEKLGGNEELTTDLIAQNGEQKINAAIQALVEKQKNPDTTDQETEEIDSHINLLEKGLAKTVQAAPAIAENQPKLPTVSETEGAGSGVGDVVKPNEKVAELEAERDMDILREKVPEMKSVKEVVPSVEEVSAGSVGSEALLVNKKKRQELKNKYSELKKLFECLTKS